LVIKGFSTTSICSHLSILSLTFSVLLDAPTHLLPSKQNLNQQIREDIYTEYIEVTQITTLEGFGLKIAFYFEHFLALRDGLVF
jgi:C4-dicarboxylate transporter